ncbi:LysM peptidoglycan-binding domain-containing protein [Aureimonas leprariae]|uniref:LysM peptidoglycan-binding domain-containing protein n=1 Tax=Plantimonas leprariae TaxID=2615207 RepID=A0A7V7PQM6_9HYPH|nr:LysM peptidoglycan-binding domain-containing protein [Aureimonas leprariae]KAB0680647.1 LysM peptidoglycan-binding domain-containing protein [Aureimonas leprariae]
MSRKFSILVAFCVVLFGAILAGYWDMLDSEKLRLVRDQASDSVAELTGTRSDAGGTSSDGAPPVQTPPAVVPASPEPVAAAGAAAEPGTGAAGPTEAAGGAPASEQPTREASLPPAAPPAAQSPKAPAASPAAEPPRFDILRVEPDGSAVLAGRAAPNAEVKLLDGERTLGTAKASPGGDFAIVLDERLPAGDHQIRIEAAGNGKPPTQSEETAIVSVPRPGEPGELLAMVEAPNRPSRIITLPSAEPAAKGPAEAPDVAAAGSGDTDESKAAAPAGTVETAANQPEPSVKPALSAPPPAVAAIPQNPAKTPAAASPSPFGVEAVEIENGRVYIAGRAPGTDPVRVYIDNKLVGEDSKRANGRFLVTAKVPLATGDHQIRADMITTGGIVASRVEVPFAKPEGEAMSAIASNDAGGGEDRPAPPASSVEPPAPAVPSATPAPAASAAVAAATPSAAEPSGQPEATASAPAPLATPPASTPPAEVAVVAKPVDAAKAPSPAATEETSKIATVRQPALESVQARVLIRRGDSLWRISRQTYGAGRRYTVIYLANGDQIRNPNRIYPGQVFRLPKHDAKPGSTASN